MEEEQDKLREELKTTLAEMTYSKLAQIDSETMDASINIQKKIPLSVFVG